MSNPGHNVGTRMSESTANRASQEGAAVQETGVLRPRLLDLKAAGAYLGVSYWSARNLVDRGVLPKVELPICPRSDGRVLRRILIDRKDLDALVEANKERML